VGARWDNERWKRARLKSKRMRMRGSSRAAGGWPRGGVAETASAVGRVPWLKLMKEESRRGPVGFLWGEEVAAVVFLVVSTMRALWLTLRK
jgi:hypothetical protein